MRIVKIAGILFVCGLAAPMRAQAAPPPSNPADRIARTPELELTLERYRELVMRDNLAILMQSLQADAADRVRRAEEGGAFEPVTVLTAERTVSERDNTTEQEAVQGTDFFDEDNRLLGAALEQFLPSGGRLRLGYTARELSNNLLDEREDRDGREYDAFLGLSLVQPLLRNAGPAATMARIRLSRADAEIAFQELRRRIMQTLARAESAYWELYLAGKRLELREESERIARMLLEDNQARVSAGKMSEIEVQQAAAGLALRQARSLEARRRLTEAESRTRTFIAELSETAELPLKAATSPRVELPDSDMDDLMRRTLRTHPVYLVRLQQARQEGVRLDYTGNQRWPQLDLQASYGFNGVSDRHGEAWRRIRESENPAWSLGLELRVPLGGGLRERHELAAAQIRRRESILAVKAAEIDIANTLYAAARGLDSHMREFRHYQSVSDLMQLLLDTELTRLDAGQSDSRKVLQAEEDLAGARDAAFESAVKFMIASIELDLAGGWLLKNRDLETARPARARAARP